MHEILPPKGTCKVSCDLLKFLEISYSMSLMDQVRDIVAMEQ